jgi:hypothetical protein
MRVEWAKAHARVERWEEEIELLLEEMRRVPWYMKWKTQWWVDQAAGRGDEVSPLLKSGCRAYAAKQAYIWSSLGEKFRGMWTPLLEQYGISVEWPA